MGIDSKLRACNLVKLRVRDVCHGDRIAGRATVLRQKTQRPAQFEISPGTLEAVQTWVRKAGLGSDDSLRVRLRLQADAGCLSIAPIAAISTSESVSFCSSSRAPSSSARRFAVRMRKARS